MDYRKMVVTLDEMIKDTEELIESSKVYGKNIDLSSTEEILKLLKRASASLLVLSIGESDDL